MAKKFYVVFEGKQPGIYDNWAECKKQIDGVKGSKFKGFPNVKEAEEALAKHISHDELTKEQVEESISVDVSCRPSPGVMEYRVVKTLNEELIFSSETYPLGTNNIGEFMALVKGMQIVKENGQMDRIIFADSQTALSWVRKKKTNSNLVRNESTNKLYKDLEEAVKWLHNVELDHFKIVKWETHIHGEIKADYGRKTSKKI